METQTTTWVTWLWKVPTKRKIKMNYLQSIAGLQDSQCVLTHVLHGGVSVHTGDAQKLHTGGSQSDHDGLCVIHPAVYIHQQLLLHHGPWEESSHTSTRQWIQHRNLWRTSMKENSFSKPPPACSWIRVGVSACSKSSHRPGPMTGKWPLSHNR